MIARRAVIAAAIAATAALAVWLVRHPPSVPENRGQGRVGDLRLRLHEIEVRGLSGGEKDWVLRADSIEVPRRGGVKILKKVREAVLYRSGEPYLTMEAGEIRVDEGKRTLSVHDGLAARIGERVRFSAPSADWDPRQSQLVCAAPVVLELGRTRLTAPQMICDTRRREFVCPSGVSVEAGRSNLRAERLVAGIEDEVLSMSGNVRGRFWIGEVERMMTEDEVDRALLERVQSILRTLSSRAGCWASPGTASHACYWCARRPARRAPPIPPKSPSSPRRR